ncbi:MAG: RND family transporter [Haloarculaceae archaeon]
MNYQRYIDWTDDKIVNHPERVIVTFLVITAVFGIGLGNISTSAGTSQFTTDLPSEQAYQDVQREFSPAFAPDTGSTQLIQSERNVLSKPSLLRMLRAEKRINDADGLRVTSTSSAADVVATQLDPSTDTYQEKITAVEQATPTEIDAAVRRSADSGSRFTGLLSKDFNRKSASASATIGVVSHELPAGISSGSGQGGSSPLTPIQERIQRIVASVGGDIDVFGSGLISAEFSRVIVDSLLIVVPAAVIFITFFLIVAYRDLLDLLLGVLSLFMAVVWTFGFMGLAGIPFSQMLIAVPPLLLAVGIDFGIHAVNRYREERVHESDIGEAMRVTTDQLLVAFFIVTGTTVIGFMSNYSSALAPIKDFGVVASIGITFTFFIFGVFLPAAKVYIDRRRDGLPIPTFSQTPLGSEESGLGSVLRGGVVVANRAPALFLIVVLLSSASMGAYATGVSTSFSQEDFLPPENVPHFLKELPEPFAPSEYTITAKLNFLEDHFQSTQGDTATVYVKGPMRRDYALEMIHRAGENPPDSFVENGRQADASSIITVIRSRAQRDPQFRALVERNDRNDNGIPDDNLETIYDYLLSSSSRSEALTYITEDYSSAKVVYSVEADASQSEIRQNAQTVASRYRYTAIATGQTIVFEAVSDLILRSALVSLALALIGSAVFLLLMYWILEGRASLAIANIVPIVVTVAFLAGTMRYVGIAFNALTATILAITIGMGIDYSVHVVHRFADERHEHDLETALDRTVRGTGGALLGSMLTTVFGIGVLALAVFPAIGQFGVLTGLSIVYAFLSSLVVLPSTLVLWDRAVTRRGSGLLERGRPDVAGQNATDPDPDVDD